MAAANGGTWVLVSFRSIAREKLCWFYKPTTEQVRILLARRLLPVSFTVDLVIPSVLLKVKAVF